MSDSSDSDLEPISNRRGRKRKLPSSSQSSSESSSDEEEINVRRKRTRQLSSETSEGSSTSSSIRNVLLDSDNDTIEEISIMPYGRFQMRRRHIVSSNSDLGSPDSDIIGPTRTIRGRRLANRSRTVIPDSSEGSDSTEEVTDEGSATGNGYGSDQNKNGRKNESTDPLSDSGDETSEKCAICLRSISNQEVGSPEGCDHMFCLKCLELWSKNKNKCPLDRQPFKLILVRENKHGEVVRQLPVEEPPMQLDALDLISCWLCGGSDREDELLLCDGCDRGYHLDCLDPPLDAVPDVSEWFCPLCNPQLPENQIGDASSNDEQRAEQDDESRGGERGGRQQSRNSGRSRAGRRQRRPQSPYTRQSRFIWAAVQESIESIEMALRHHYERTSSQQPSTSRGDDSGDDENPRASGSQSNQTRASTSRTGSRRVAKKKNVTTRKRKRKTKRKRYTVRKKKILIKNEDGTVAEEIVEIGKRVTRRRKKRRVVKRRPRTASHRLPAPARTVRGRLARTLGMVAQNQPGQLLPDVSSRRRETTIGGSISSSRASAGIPTLHIFGPRNELAPVSSESEGEIDIGEGNLGLVTRRPLSLSTRHRDRSKAAAMLRLPPRPRLLPQPTATNTGPVDLLGSILESQTIWHSKNTDVTIRSDGTVETRPNGPLDVRSAGLERAKEQAPMQPTSGSQPSDIRPYQTSVEPSNSTQSNYSGAQTTDGSQHFGSSRGSNEGYTNFLNTGPNLFCRGGPPSRARPQLRFRLPPRPQLRRIPLLLRPPLRSLLSNRPQSPRAAWPTDQDKTSADGEDSDGSSHGPNAETDSKPADEDVDLYSDIESNHDDDDPDGGNESFPALGPPPEPPAFLLGIEEEEEKKNESDVYDPAEPCDSDEEMVIDESRDQRPAETSPLAPTAAAAQTPPRPPTPPALPSPPAPPAQNVATETNENVGDDDDGDFSPIRGVYSAASLEYSNKDEEERARDLMELQKLNRSNEETELPQSNLPSSPIPQPLPEEPKHAHDRIGARLSFNIENTPEDSQDSSALSERSASPSGVKEANQDISKSPEKIILDQTEEKPIEEPATPSSSRSISMSPQYPTTEEQTDDVPTKKYFDSEELKSPQSSTAASHDNREENESMVRINTGLEGLDVEEVSSELEENDFNDKGSACSLSLSELSNRSRHSPTVTSKKRKRRKKRERSKAKSDKCASEEGEIGNERDTQKDNNENTCDENKTGDNEKSRNLSKSRSSERQILSSKENKKGPRTDRDLSWKKPSKKEKNYREGRKLSKERGRSRERRKSRSNSPKKDRKKTKDKRKNDKRERKKEIERYDVRKIVKNKEVRRTDAFGRDLPSKSLSLSRSRSRSRGRGRNNLRRTSRSISKSPLRPLRRQRSPRRRLRSRSRSSPSPRRNKKKPKSSERKGRSRTPRPRRSRSRRRSLSRSPRPARFSKKTGSRKSRSRSISLSPPPRPSSPIRLRRSASPIRLRASLSPMRDRRSFSRSWSRLHSPAPRDPSLEKLTVVVTAKDKKKRKKRKEEKRMKRPEMKKKKSGNSKEVFASGDNVLVSVNFNRTNKSGGAGRIASISPLREITKQKKKRIADELDRPGKKSKTGSVTKTVVDAALATQVVVPKRKKLTRLNEKDAEIILSRKPVAVIDLDMSPYKEQTPSPVNVVVVSDSGSDEEGKAVTPARPRSPALDGSAAAVIVVPPAPYLPAQSGPKTPPEPPVKFSISKPQQLRPIANPLADGDDGMDDEQAIEGGDQLDNELEPLKDVPHKGPNTPPEPRGPSTPKTPPSPSTSPDAYDPFEPTKSRSPSPIADDQETQEEATVPVVDDSGLSVSASISDDAFKSADNAEHDREEICIETEEVAENTSPVEATPAPVESQEAAGMLGTSQNKLPLAAVKKASVPVPPPNAQSTLPVFSLPSPNKTPNRQQNVSGIQRLQHRLGSPVNKTPNSVKSTPEKRGTELLSTGNFKIRNAAKRNGENKSRPPQDAASDPIDMDDSPYSPATSEGDDLFDPPADPPKPGKQPSAAAYKPGKTAAPVKAANKFDLLFGPSGPTLSPLKNGSKKPIKAGKGLPQKLGGKGSKKASKKGISLKMDEDQLRILDDLPSSAVELQVKDKFLKKLNRQERVVDEVKTVLKPHYARKHITKEEYKEILRKAVPKICHSKSGEINPSKIQLLVEAYVRKYRHAKKKAGGIPAKPKAKKAAIFS